MSEKKKFRLFDMNRDGKGVEKEIEGPKNLVNFFKHYFRKFSKLLSLNLIMLFMVIPLFIALMVYFMGPTVNAPESVLFPTLYGSSFISRTPVADISLTLQSSQLAIPVYNSYIYYVIGAIALFYLITFGWQNVGATYILKNLVNGEPVFLISDYFYAIKKNFKQGFFLGLIDCIAIFLLTVDFLFFNGQPASYGSDLMYVVTVALIVIYLIMRFYTYIQLVTFNLNNWKIIKNSFIFTALGIKRNIVAILGIIVIVAINTALIMLFLPIRIIVPAVLPFFYLTATVGFIKAYTAYPVLEKYMIEPDLNNDHKEDTDTENEV